MRKQFQLLNISIGADCVDLLCPQEDLSELNRVTRVIPELNHARSPPSYSATQSPRYYRGTLTQRINHGDIWIMHGLITNIPSPLKWRHRRKCGPTTEWSALIFKVQSTGSEYLRDASHRYRVRLITCSTRRIRKSPRSLSLPGTKEKPEASAPRKPHFPRVI